MGYQMPIVCKEIYLPVNDDFISTGVTYAQYKEKYGIDLDDIFGHSVDDNIVTITFKEKAKIYLVLEKNTYSMFPRVAPINAVYNNGDGDVIICSYTLDPDTGDVTAAYGLIIRDDKTIGYFEL